MNLEIGTLAAATLPSGTGTMRVVGQVTEVRATVVDGHGYERQLDAKILELPTTQEMGLYWRDRALNAERDLARLEASMHDQKANP